MSYLYSAAFSEPEDLNIVAIILESVGKLAWLRHGPELHKYIEEELGGVMLEKHTKIGLNTGRFGMKLWYTLLTFRDHYLSSKTDCDLTPTLVQITEVAKSAEHVIVQVRSRRAKLDPTWILDLKQLSPR